MRLNNSEITNNIHNTHNVYDDIQFLKQFKDMRNNQPNDGNAHPVYWSIMDYKNLPTGSDYADETLFLFDNGDAIEFNDVDELIGFLKDYDDEIVFDEDIGFNDLIELLLTHHNEDECFRYVPIMNVSYIVPNTLFLSKEDAVTHLKLNRHHYSEKAHTYAMTAWRSSSTEKVLDILSRFNWDNVHVGNLKE